ncbi:MAG: triphosphoribosyl-dephospho-CoA synthase [Gammaproteobacteria bacterium]|nr:MAG: triphosphoribosyl-dephospho-CoA synthase [Gammaproteobacteria bacterium]
MLSTSIIHNCIVWACEQEVSAPKPGNVNCLSDGHNMQVADFINSAHAIAPIMSQPNITVGEMILQAITATRKIVDCNTNLGIVLLFAPLCVAIQHCTKFEQLSKALDKVLNNLSIDDAKLCYQAIRLAEAGGMGKVEQHDIQSRPTITLKQAMEMAKKRDSVARQYVNNYDEILSIGLPNLTSAINCGESVEWATAFAYLRFLSSIPDTLICRKQGLKCAQQVTEKARLLTDKISKNKKLSQLSVDIILWDNELKHKAINPGTTADMTAATLLVYAFEQTFC